MGLTSSLEDCEILFHDGTFRERDLLGQVSDDVPPLLCKECGRVWVMGRDSLGLFDRVTSWLFPRSWAMYQFAKVFSKIGVEREIGVTCPFCKAEKGFTYDSPRVAGFLRHKRKAWFSANPVRWDEEARYSFSFRSGYVAHTLGEFLAFVGGNWDVASWHFAEGHMEDWLRAIGRKDLAAMMGSSKRSKGNGRESYDHWLSRLKKYGAV